MYTDILSRENARIFLIDDHPALLDQIACRLNHEEDFAIVGKATESAQVVRNVLRKKPNVLLIDPIMQDGEGLELLKRIKEAMPLIKIVVLTSFPDAALQVELNKLGVLKVLEKGVASQEIVDALRGVL